MDLEDYTLVDRVILKEDISAGDKIRSARVSVIPALGWLPVPVHQSMSVGHKLIATFPPIRTKHIHVEIEGEDGASLTEISLVKAEEV